MKKFLSVIFVFALCLVLTGCGCAKRTVTVTFDTNSDTKISSQTIKKGEMINEPSIPTRQGYTFDGWYYNGEKFDFSTEIKEDIELEARWLKENALLYTISFNTNGGNKIADIKVENNKTIGNLPIPVKSGYKFIGWFIGNTEINSNTIVVKDMNLFAKWEKETTTKKKTTKKKTTTKTTTKAEENENVTTKTTTTKPVTTKQTTTKTTTKQATTKQTTTKTTTKQATTNSTTTAPVDKIEATIEQYKDSVEQVIIYLKKNDKIVSGTCDIITKNGKKITKHIGTNGLVTDNKLVDEIINIKLD